MSFQSPFSAFLQFSSSPSFVASVILVMLSGRHASRLFSILAGKKKRTNGGHESRGEAVAQTTNTMQFDLNLAGPPVIHVYDGENTVVKAEKGSENELGVVGDRMNPIAVDDYQNGGVPEEVLVEFAIAESLLDLDCFEVGPFDPKGKRVRIEGERRVRRPARPREVGESSNPPPPEPDAYCGICMEPKFEYECFAMKNCCHVYCSSCVCRYVEVKVEENVSSIGCPDPSCKDGCLEPEMCRFILRPEVFSRWGQALCEATIGTMKFYCPFKDCSALLVDERVLSGGEVITQSECPHCFRLFCAQCKVPWHSGVDCAEFAELGANERGREDIMLRNMAKQSHWQRCPACNFYVERISGCMFIKCRCGHQFCYGCARPMTVDHYCRKCRR